MQFSSIQQKLFSIHKNISQLPTPYRNEVLSLKAKQSSQKLDQLDNIKIQTFYRLIQPAIYSLHWQIPNQEINYPVAGIIVDKNNQTGFFGVRVQTATWIQSGGTRCIPIKSSITQPQIQQLIKLTHCSIFLSISKQLQNYKQFIKTFLKITSQQNHYPILFIGRSCLIGLQCINNYKICYDDKGQPGPSEIYISYDNLLFKGLDLGLRLQLQNTKKITYPPHKLQLSNLATVPGIQPKVYMRTKTQTIVTVLQHKQKKIFFLLNQPAQFENPQSIQLWHCAISNFIDQVKAQKREVNEKKVQKHLLAHHPIVYHSDQAFYKIG